MCVASGSCWLSLPQAQPEGYISPSVTFITTGAGGVLADVYAAATLSGPTSFGTGGFHVCQQRQRRLRRHQWPRQSFHLLLVPMGYVPGNALSDSSTYNGATFTTPYNTRHLHMDLGNWSEPELHARCSCDWSAGLGFNVSPLLAILRSLVRRKPFSRSAVNLTPSCSRQSGAMATYSKIRLAICHRK